jgi:sulfur carrier protein
MEIILNGEKTTISSQENLMTYIKGLGAQWEIELEGAVVLLNNDIVKRDIWNETSLKEGDSLEVLSFVSGG